jgi:hypothetical protein
LDGTRDRAQLSAATGLDAVTIDSFLRKLSSLSLLIA